MKLERLQPHQRDELAKLIHTSLDVWHRTRLNTDRFGNEWEPFRLTVEVYEALDPGCCVVAMDDSGALVGSAFFHPRETHVGVGVVSVHPTVFGRGVGRALMEEIIRLAAGKPLRLVSSAMNLDSFSLYTRLGFVPQLMLQSMTLQVPTAGFPGASTRMRPATMADVAAIADFEFRLNGIRKEQDYPFFVENQSGRWRLAVIEKPDGSLAGFLAASALPPDNLLGQGVAEDEATMLELMRGMLDQHFRGQSVAFILPSRCSSLVQQAYAWGARNRETNLLSVLGDAPPMRAITLPTFLPESG
ncbi:MAG: GNAT family N-acetyltransferase [Verrucomicrobia bacterium]|nr:GNAT family N-acetyltransferase [Verrucomicrobiota bacterium]